MPKSLILGLFFCFLSLSAYADIALPEARRIQVETKQNFTDYDFYYASVATNRTYGPKGGIEILFDSLKIIPIKFSVSDRYYVPSRQYDESAYFLAIKKNPANENLEELKKKIISTIKKEKSDNIHFFYLSKNIEDDAKYGKVNVIYIVESITKRGITTFKRIEDTVSFQTELGIYAVIGLIITAIIITLGIFLIKKLKKG